MKCEKCHAQDGGFDQEKVDEACIIQLEIAEKLRWVHEDPKYNSQPDVFENHFQKPDKTSAKDPVDQYVIHDNKTRSDRDWNAERGKG